MKVLGIIPARGGSKGIPGKNIKALNGKPLIAYTIEQALASSIDHTILSTDSENIIAVAQKYGVEVPFSRPAELATSTARSIDVIIHAVEFMKARGDEYDAICLLQATSPYRPGRVIDEAIATYADSGSKSLISVRKIPDHYNPYWAFEKGENSTLQRVKNEEPIISRRQDLPEAYHRDGAIYIVDTSFLLSEKKLISDDVAGFEIDSPELINIDGPEDWAIAEKYMN